MFSKSLSASSTWRIFVAVKDTYLLALSLLCVGLAVLFGVLTVGLSFVDGIGTVWPQMAIVFGLLVAGLVCIASMNKATDHMMEYYRFRGDRYPPDNWLQPAFLSIACAFIAAIALSAPSNFMSFSSLLGPIPVAPWHGGELQLTPYGAIGLIGLLITSALVVTTFKKVATELEDYRTGRAGSF